MEGHLYKWTNYIMGWKRRYFVLYNGVLQYWKEKGQQRQGAIHLNVAQILPHNKNARRILIDTGSTVIHLKANNEADALQWINALKAAQELQLQESQREEMKEAAGSIAPSQQNVLNAILQKVSSLWDLHAQLEEASSHIRSAIKSHLPELSSFLQISEELKMIATEVLNLFEEEFISLSKATKETTPTNKEWSRSAIFREMSEIQSIDQPNEDQFYDALDESGMAKVAEGTARKVLPVIHPPQKLSVWKHIKDSIGKDVTKLTLPIQFHEPITMLQRTAEDLAFSYLLEKADKTDNQWLRLAYVACFAVSTYANTINRALKPFNPILGETFELERNGFKLLAEQITQSPPTSVLHCNHPNFTFWSTTILKSMFNGSSLEILPAGDLHVTLTHHGDEYVWRKAKTTVNNMVLGKVVVDHHGHIDVVNGVTGDMCRIKIRKMGWFETHPRNVEGTIVDSQNVAKARVFGTWSDHLIVRNELNGEETIAWELPTAIEDSQNNYYFSEFALQLNAPPEDYPSLLPESDSRYRTDLRAVENAEWQTATSEQMRIEEKQRSVRKLREAEKVIHTPRWFSYENGEWKYSGGYWESKHLGRFDNIPALF